MKKVSITVILIICFCRLSSGQKNTVLDSLILPELIDTLFIDRNVNNWSLRLFTNFKSHRFTLRNNNHALNYIPNNPFGIGLGLATKKVLLDVGINIKGNKEDETNRIDIQANLMLHKHLFDFSLQRYEGFNVLNDDRKNLGFREDILSFALTLEYLYLFSADFHSIDIIRSRQARQKQIETSFALGGFAVIRNQLADSSIIPIDQNGYFNDYARIMNLEGIGAGIKGSFISIFPLPYNFFTSLSFSPGFGLMYKSVEAEDNPYYPSNLFLLNLDLGGVIGYSGDKIYITLRLALGYYGTSLDYDNIVAFSTGNAKLAIGYKLGGIRKN